MNLKQCLGKGLLKESTPNQELADKEFKEAEYDLKKAADAFKSGDHKWTIVKSYYSMFHSAKAVLFQLWFVEKSHIAIIAVLEDLEKRGKLEYRFTTYFRSAMNAREDADYHYTYSKEVSEHELKLAEEFLK